VVDIIAFGAHPDDIEFGCGGILAKAAAHGYSMLLVDLTSGEKGTNGTPELRRQEALSAAKIIGAERLFLDFADCEIIDSYQGRLKLVSILRKYKPRLVLAPSDQEVQNHPDHIASAKLIRHACRYARFAKILPELPIHRIEGILHYLSHSGTHADFLIDISENVEAWKEMMICHQSQLKTLPYNEWVLRGSSYLGGLIGKAYAQGLIAHNPIEIENIMSISRGIREI